MSKKEKNKSEEELAREPGQPEESAGTVAEPAAGTVSPEEVGELFKKLDEAIAESNANKERYLRTVADLENYRKRAVREKEEARRQANCGLLEDLLPVLDNFKLGLKSAAQHEGGEAFAEGFRMILNQMESALKNNGLEEINPLREPFDPNFHESVAHIPHEEIREGHVIEVQRTGYRLFERLLRPATVIVSSGAPEKAATGEDPAMDVPENPGENS
ncbi:MAG: nucleotide exchange factor GrpE [Oceanipulchritudo sp.]